MSPRVSTPRCTRARRRARRTSLQLGAAWCSRSIARCARPARLCATNASICAGSSICCAAIEAARDDRRARVVAFDDAHPFERGEHLQGAAHMGVRDGVIVQIEAQVRGLCVRRTIDALLAGKGLCRVSASSIADAPRSNIAARCGRDLPGRPLGRLAFDTRRAPECSDQPDVVERRAAKNRSRTKRIARSTRPFSLPRATATGGVGNDTERPIPAASDGSGSHRRDARVLRSEIVIQQGPGHGTEAVKCVDVAAQEAGHRGVQIKAQEQVPRVREHHHEGHQRAPRACRW